MPTEIEAKFYLPDLAALGKRLIELGANLIQARVFEKNLRFDTATMQLSAGRKVLRLRQDEKAHLTFKAPGHFQDGVLVRPEFEVEVSDFSLTRQLLEGLGYQVYSSYEKYRQTYCLDAVSVMLDEMPYGNFVELEGSSAQAVKTVAGKLGLDLQKRIGLSYLVLFEHLKKVRGLTMRDLSFENFEGLTFTAADFEDLPEI